MSLASIQQAMGEALLSTEGLGVLKEEAAWTVFLARPEGKALQGCDRARLYLYEELLFASVEDTLASLFPVTHAFLKPDWYRLVEQYRRQFPNTSFQLYHVARDFPEFVKGLKGYLNEYPFLWDLAWYEWLEMEVLNEENRSISEALQLGFPAEVDALSSFQPVLNPIRRQHTFDYPMHTILEAVNHRQEAAHCSDDADMSELTVAPGPTNILIYRDPETNQARFFNLNPLTAAVVAGLAEAPNYYALFEALHQTQPALAQVPFETVLSQGIGLLNQCFQQKILLGSVALAE